jgi:hypothetical protein
MRDSMHLLAADPDLAGPPEYEPDDGEAQLIAEAFADARAELDAQARNATVTEGQRVRFTASPGETCEGTVTLDAGERTSMTTCAEYEAIIARGHAAREAVLAARAALERAEAEQDAAELALSRHEISPGVPLCTIAGAGTTSAAVAAGEAGTA